MRYLCGLLRECFPDLPNEDVIEDLGESFYTSKSVLMINCRQWPGRIDPFLTSRSGRGESMLKVLVNGAHGKMGQEVVRAIEQETDMTLVGQSDRDDKIEDAIWFSHPDVVVDFTHHTVVKSNAIRILNSKCHAVVGTTGLSESDLAELDELAKGHNVGVLVCPNFAIGGVLMMKYAAEISKYMPSVEIIEMHHDKKGDAPSGTALKTADMIYRANPYINSTFQSHLETEIVKGARGGKKYNIPIHSVRLQGYVAHQEVLFGGLGQTLSLRHDSISRESFMPGVILGVRKVSSLHGLVYGLENIL